jgi:hypothetical protein
LVRLSFCYQRGDRRVAAEEFQVWKLTVKPDRTATLTCDDGNGNVVASEEIPGTFHRPHMKPSVDSSLLKSA